MSFGERERPENLPMLRGCQPTWWWGVLFRTKKEVPAQNHALGLRSYHQKRVGPISAKDDSSFSIVGCISMIVMQQKIGVTVGGPQKTPPSRVRMEKVCSVA